MPKKAWNGRGVLSEGVAVKFTGTVAPIRKVKRPPPWGSPAAELKREEEEARRREAEPAPSDPEPE